VSTTPRTWVVGEVVTAAEMNTEIRDQFNEVVAAGVAYTPVWSGLTALGSSTAHGRALKVGRRVSMTADLAFGTGSTLGTGSITVSLPYTASSSSNSNLGWHGLGRFVDGAGGSWKALIAMVQPGGTSATVFAIRQTDLGWVTPGTGAPSWAAGASMRFSLDYEAAS
jgi:hypothetical protein